MKYMNLKERISPYILFVLGIGITLIFSHFSKNILHIFTTQQDTTLLTFFSISALFILSFTVHHLSNKTVFPSFVGAIFFGLAAAPLLEPLTQNKETLGIIVGIGATLILFSGGLETPFQSFKKLLPKILSLSFIGLVITAFLFSIITNQFAFAFHISLPLTVSILLGAILASTDPAAIIPVLKRLRFHKRETKDIIISESAVTDVTGTLLTLVFLTLTAHATFPSVVSAYSQLFNKQSGLLLLEEIAFGVVFGVLGSFLLTFLTRFTKQRKDEAEVDAAFFLFVPLSIFALAAAFHGSGYLAAFVAGLLFLVSKHLQETEQFFNHMIEGFMKPIIFILLGAIVNIESMIHYAPLGIVCAFTFMFLIRPISVFISLTPFLLFKNQKMPFTDLLFISFVRETGAIPAVLLVTLVSLGIPGSEALVPLGMWVILCTLIIQPPLTPLVAKYLKVATPLADEEQLELGSGKLPFVILASRGFSFLDRLSTVVEWASHHNIPRIVLLHCLEDKYTPELAEDVKEQAKTAFEQMNKHRVLKGESPLEFDYIGRKGLLQDNIDIISKKENTLTTIFVGKRVLDYRLEEIKNLKVPLFFLD